MRQGAGVAERGGETAVPGAGRAGRRGLVDRRQAGPQHSDSSGSVDSSPALIRFSVRSCDIEQSSQVVEQTGDFPQRATVANAGISAHAAIPLRPYHPGSRSGATPAYPARPSSASLESHSRSTWAGSAKLAVASPQTLAYLSPQTATTSPCHGYASVALPHRLELVTTPTRLPGTPTLSLRPSRRACEPGRPAPRMTGDSVPLPPDPLMVARSGPIATAGRELRSQPDTPGLATLLRLCRTSVSRPGVHRRSGGRPPPTDS